MQKKLQPFSGTHTFEIEGRAEFQSGFLQLDYEFLGETPPVEWSDRPVKFKRENRLWEKTCLEAFLANRGEPAYWEFNCSPALEWNVFHFDDYRQGMKEETRIPPPKLSFERGSFRAIFDLRSLPISEPECSVSSVILGRDGSLSYWAWKHARQDADFHDRASFFRLTEHS